MKSEDDEDQHQGRQVREGPHQVVLLRTLTDITFLHVYMNRRIKRLQVTTHPGRLPASTESTGRSSYHEEEWRAHVSEELRSVGGDGVDSSAPGQGVEPRLADHIQVGGDVVGGVLTAT